MLKDKGTRLVVMQLMGGVREQSRYQLHGLFGEDAFCDTLDDVMQAYRQ